jgi:hypothetical protein
MNQFYISSEAKSPPHPVLVHVTGANGYMYIVPVRKTCM